MGHLAGDTPSYSFSQDCTGDSELRIHGVVSRTAIKSGHQVSVVGARSSAAVKQSHSANKLIGPLLDKREAPGEGGLPSKMRLPE